MNLSYSMLPIMMMLILFLCLKAKMESLILSILLINLSGLIPEFWCLTSYVWGNIIMSILTWSLFSMNKIFRNFTFWSAHLLPLGAPEMLWLFLIVLELISQLIRPITLSLRLTCNLMSGHVMISLVTSIKTIGLIVLMIILFFELCVAVIQSIVFNLLIESYKSE